ncbi:MAG TPA: hypothetical protein VFT74_16585 [Isosphaeraceae bacterium]|nr:hypothetical protein [Isosphaeraceae bacterium]
MFWRFWRSKRKKQKRTFQPSLENGRLEQRQVLSAASAHVAAMAAAHRGPVHVISNMPLSKEGLPQAPQPYVQTGVGNGGRAAIMVDTDGEVYAAHLTGGGTVRAKAVRGGQVDLYVYGSNVNSILTIDPEYPSITTGTAHSFSSQTATQDGLIHIRNIIVTNGHIGQILGYQTATVSGLINVNPARAASSATNVDRIAFYDFLPGATINVGGTLDTLDVYHQAAFAGAGTGIHVGLDLNDMTVGMSLILENGATMTVGRDLGQVVQAAKGTGPGGVGLLVQGDMIVGTGSSMTVNRYVGPLVNGSVINIRGNLIGFTNLSGNLQYTIDRLGLVYGVVLP